VSPLPLRHPTPKHFPTPLRMTLLTTTTKWCHLWHVMLPWRRPYRPFKLLAIKLIQ